MKIKHLLLGLGLILSTFSFAQINTPKTTKALYAVKEATWCGNCGRYGLPNTDTIINRTNNNDIYLSLHHSSSSALYSATAKDLYDGFNNSLAGQPMFGANGRVFGAYSVNNINAIADSMNNFHMDTNALINAGFEYTFRNDSVIVNCETKFFSAANGTYRLNVYLIEDSVYAYQSNYDPAIPSGDIYHKHILRTGVASDAFGDVVATGSVGQDSIITTSFAIALNSTWDTTHLHLFSAIWKDNGGSYEYVNGNDQGLRLIDTTAMDTTSMDTTVTDTTSMDTTGNGGNGGNPTGIVENLNSSEITIYPNPTSGIMHIENHQPVSGNYSIMDLRGQVVKTGIIKPSSINTINLESLDKGVYYFRYGEKSKRLILTQ